jgi:signal peptidase I
LAVVAGAIPLLVGGNSWTVTNGSMAPAVDVGDLVVTKGVSDPAAVEVGQIVVFPGRGDRSAPVIHRVVGEKEGENGRRLTTKGDSNAQPDKLTVAEKDVMGIYMYRIPKLGYAISWADRNGMTVIIILSILVVLLTVGLFVLAARQRRLLGPAEPKDPGSPGSPGPPAGAAPPGAPPVRRPERPARRPQPASPGPDRGTPPAPAVPRGPRDAQKAARPDSGPAQGLAPQPPTGETSPVVAPGRRSAVDKASVPWAPSPLSGDNAWDSTDSQRFAGPPENPPPPSFDEPRRSGRPASQGRDPVEAPPRPQAAGAAAGGFAQAPSATGPSAAAPSADSKPAGHDGGPNPPPLVPPGLPRPRAGRTPRPDQSDGIGRPPGVADRPVDGSPESHRPRPIPWLSGLVTGGQRPHVAGGGDTTDTGAKGRPGADPRRPAPAERVVSTRPDTVARPVAFMPHGPGVEGVSTGELPARRPRRIGDVESVADRLPHSEIPPGGAPRPWGAPEPEPPAPRQEPRSLADRIPRAQTPPWPIAPRSARGSSDRGDNDLEWMDDLGGKLRPWDAPD